MQKEKVIDGSYIWHVFKAVKDRHQQLKQFMTKRAAHGFAVRYMRAHQNG